MSMVTRSLFCASATLSCLVAAPAIAQSGPTTTAPVPSRPSLPSLPPPRTYLPWRVYQPSPSSTALPFANAKVFSTSYDQVRVYGRCVSNISDRAARRFLEAAPNSADERWELRRMRGFASACLPFGYVAPVIFLRGGVAEALYRRAPIVDALHARGTTEQDLIAFQAAENSRSFARLGDDRTFTALANCLAVRAPVQTRRFLFSKPGSDAELGAIDGLLGATPSCAGGARFPRDGARTFLRAYVAESAYRWATFAAA